MSKKVLVLMGGFSAEREVSLVSGQGISEALKKSGYTVVPYDLTNVKDFISTLEQEKPDVVFNALHGNWGEDGEIQGLLDLLQIPYTHSGLNASAIGMNKFVTREICKSVGIKVAEGQRMNVATFKQLAANLPMPYVVKPVSDGSSVGVYIITKPEDLAMIDYKVYGDEKRDLLVEKYIPGKELTVMVLEDKAYVVTELRSKVEFYDYNAKYSAGVTEHILPADVPFEVAEICKRYAERMHKVLECNTVSRSDLRYNEEDGVIFLEINTHPGMTPLSLVPEQARYVGISYEELCDKLVNSAKYRGME